MGVEEDKSKEDCLYCLPVRPREECPRGQEGEHVGGGAGMTGVPRSRLHTNMPYTLKAQDKICAIPSLHTNLVVLDVFPTLSAPHKHNEPPLVTSMSHQHL